MLGTEPDFAPRKSQDLDALFELHTTDNDENAEGNELPLFDAKPLNDASSDSSTNSAAPLPLFEAARGSEPEDNTKLKAATNQEKPSAQQMQAEDAFE